MSPVNLRVASVRIESLPDDLRSQVLAFLSGAPAPKLAKASKRTTRAKKADPLLDTRTVAELWIAGEDHRSRNKAEYKAIKAGREIRSIRVRLADGFELIACSRMADDEHAKAAAVRFVRSRAMDAEWQRREKAWLEHCQTETRKLWESGELPSSFVPPEFDDGWQWIKTAACYSVKTRACEVADVAEVEILPARERPGYEYDRPKAKLYAIGTADLSFTLGRDDFWLTSTESLSARRYEATLAKDIFGSAKLKTASGRDVFALERIRRRHAKALEARGCEVWFEPWAPVCPIPADKLREMHERADRMRKAIETFTEAKADADGLYRPEHEPERMAS